MSLTEVLASMQPCSDQGMLIAQQDPKEHTGRLPAERTTEHALWPESHDSPLSYTQKIHLHLLLDP